MRRSSVQVHRSLTAATAAMAVLLGLVAFAPTTPAAGAVPDLPGGALAVWGGNTYGQTDVPAGLDGKTVTAVAAGLYHSLALTDDGVVTAWGWDGDGTGLSDVPASLDGNAVTAIAAGMYHSLALTQDNQLVGWGSTSYGKTVLPDSLAGKTITAIAAGTFHSMALTSDGTVTAWGGNNYGQTQVPISLRAKTVVAIAAGYAYSLALTSDGTVVSWGANGGDWQTQPPASLVGKTVVAIAAGDFHSLALTDDGEIISWGYDATGQTDVPASLDDKTVTAIAAGRADSFALTSDGTITAWGLDDEGQLDVPVGLEGRRVTAISAGLYHTIAISSEWVPPEAFSTIPIPALTGTARVGETLTADPGTHAPTPDTLAYRWYADDTVIPGATAATLVLAPAQVDALISVKLTATKVGYYDAVATSSRVGPVAQRNRPSLSLEATKTTLRRGQSTTLTWASTDADEVTAGGAWTGARTTAGARKVAPTTIGTSTYRLAAANPTGTTTSQVRIKVTRPATRLKVTTPSRATRAGTRVKVTTRGLDPRERFTLRVGKLKIRVTGRADAKGAVTLRVKVPTASRTGRYTVKVVGDQPDRAGATRLRVVRR
ncbi:hypothetical protein BH11ACT8_BH11ACT8_21630 [soil metagenome]